MKILRRILIALVSILVIVLLVVLVFFRQETYQLYKVLTMFDKEVISENFRSFDKIFQTVTVPKPKNSYKFP